MNKGKASNARQAAKRAPPQTTKAGPTGGNTWDTLFTEKPKKQDSKLDHNAAVFKPLA